jgi:hypothetical protein
VLQEEIRNWTRLASIGRRRFAAKGA